MPFKKTLYVIFSVFLAFKIHADNSNLYIGTAIAGAFIQESGYENDTSRFLPNMGYQFRQVYVETGSANIGKFKLQGSADTSIEVNGLTIVIGKKFKLENTLNINIHGGAILWESEATLLGNFVGDDKDTSAIIGFGFSRDFLKSKIGIRTQLQQLLDISGTDISLLSVGINFYL